MSCHNTEDELDYYDEDNQKRNNSAPTIQYIIKHPKSEAHYMGPWSYYWLEILYSLPLIGWIFLIVHACTPSHENRCNFARSFFCWFLSPFFYFVCVLLILIAIGIITDNKISIEGFFRDFVKWFESIIEAIEKAIENSSSSFHFEAHF